MVGSVFIQPLVKIYKDICHFASQLWSKWEGLTETYKSWGLGPFVLKIKSNRPKLLGWDKIA